MPSLPPPFSISRESVHILGGEVDHEEGLALADVSDVSLQQTVGGADLKRVLDAGC